MDGDLTDQDAVHPRALASEAPIVLGRAPRLLVIEDDPDIQMLVRMVMNAAGWEVESQGLAAGAIDHIVAMRPDVIVLDMELPDISGFEVLDQMQRDPRARWVPVVVLSGDRQRATAARALHSGAQDYITKPFENDELRARLAAALRVASTHLALAEAETRFRLTFEEAPIGIAMVSPAGMWLRVNRALVEILGYTLEELRERTLDEITHPDDRPADRDLRRRLSRDELERTHTEKRFLRPDGTVVWTHVSVSLVRDDAGRPLHFVCHVEDITALRAARDALIHQTMHDQLTGLANRSLLMERLDQAVADELRHHRGLALLFLDLDGLKLVNDTHGHAVGDELIVQIAHRLRRAVRGGDTVARFGGDEFVVLAEDVDEQRALLLAERVRCDLDMPYALSVGQIHGTASIGVCLAKPGEAPESILRRADEAMYRAKQLGKDRCELSSPKLQAS